MKKQNILAERDEARRELDILRLRLSRAEQHRDEATVSYQKKRLECDELTAKLNEIQNAYDICSKVGRPCASCMQAHGAQLAEMREVIRMFYDECKCQHNSIYQANARAYSILHRFA